jgi:lipid-A-disaccharide synthase
MLNPLAASTCGVERAPRLAMVAGEASGDLLAGLLLGVEDAGRIADLASVARDGGNGFQAWWPSDKLPVRGYARCVAPLPGDLSIRVS